MIGVLPRGLPAGVVSAVSERCRALANATSGRTLEIPIAGLSSDELPTGELPIGKVSPSEPGQRSLERELAERIANGDRYDTILSLVRTPFVEDLAAFITSIRQLLAPSGCLLMLEPAGTIRRGSWSLATGQLITQATNRATPLLRRVINRSAPRIKQTTNPTAASKLNLGHRVGPVLWANDFTITDIERFDISSVPPQWSRFVELRARHQTPWSQPHEPLGTSSTPTAAPASSTQTSRQMSHRSDR